MLYEQLIKRLADKKDLNVNEMRSLMDLLLGDEANPSPAGSAGRVNDIQKTALVLALKLKGETDLEISQAVKIMRKASVKIPVKNPLIDVCGTGGSGKPKLNISTASAFVLASLGVRVLKHGNRAQTSKCGSFDLLEALGAKIELGPDQVKKIFQKLNIGFVFAPLYHPIMKNVISIRKNLAVPTVFNLIGPLCNPAGPDYQVIGVSKFDYGEKMIKALRSLRCKSAMVLYGDDGMDEASICAGTNVWELDQNQKIKHYKIQPETFGLKRVKFDQIKGGDSVYNKNKILALFSGKLKGPALDFLCLNAACGLYVYGTVKNLKQGIDLAKQAVVSGRVLDLVRRYAELSKRV